MCNLKIKKLQTTKFKIKLSKILFARCPIKLTISLIKDIIEKGSTQYFSDKGNEKMSDTDKMQTALDLIYLVSCAVNEELPDKNRISGTDLSDVLKMAQKHALSAVAAIALEKVIKLPDDFKEEKYKAIRRLSLLGFERERILRSLEEQKIWYLPVKAMSST